VLCLCTEQGNIVGREYIHNTKVDNFWVWASKLFAKLFSIMLAGKDWKDFQSCFGNSARRVKQSF
jgi:hypothetical protein